MPSLISLNGEIRAVAATSVAALVMELGLQGKPVAVERNGEVVPKRLWETTPIVAGDRIELVSLVGGG